MNHKISPRLPGLKSSLFCVGLGALYGQCFAPQPLPAWALPWLQILVLAGLLHLTLRTPRPGRAFAMGGLFGLGLFSVALYWLTISMHQYGGMPMPLALLALLLFSAYLAVYPALSCGLMRALWPHGQPATPKAIVGMALIWASLWTLSEWLRATLFTGFAWLQTAAGQVDGWLAGWSSLLGPYGIAFLTAWIAATLAATLASTSARGGSQFNGKNAWPLLLAAVMCATGAFIGQYRYATPSGEPLIIRLVQGDLDQASKFSPDGFQRAVELYQSLAGHRQEGQTVQPDLILLPETVMIQLPQQIPARVWQGWIDIARDQDATLLMGGPMPGAAPRQYTNSVYAITAQDTAMGLREGQVSGRYDKQHLVPFGEFVPWGFQWFVDLMHIPLGNFNRGANNQAPLQIDSQHVAANICYEDVFAQDLLPAVRQGATILANFSNLAWFGNSVALRQHWQMARLRAMEVQRPTVRSTNTGVTGAIDEMGQAIALLPTMAAGYLDVQIQGQSGLTPYARVGNLPVLLLSVLIVLFALFTRRRATPTQKHHTE